MYLKHESLMKMKSILHNFAETQSKYQVVNTNILQTTDVVLLSGIKITKDVQNWTLFVSDVCQVTFHDILSKGLYIYLTHSGWLHYFRSC